MGYRLKECIIPEANTSAPMETDAVHIPFTEINRLSQPKQLGDDLISGMMLLLEHTFPTDRLVIINCATLYHVMGSLGAGADHMASFRSEYRPTSEMRRNDSSIITNHCIFLASFLMG